MELMLILGLALLGIIVLGAILYAIVIFSTDNELVNIKSPTLYSDDELNKMGYFKLNFFEKWLICKCVSYENKIVCALARISSIVFWIIVAFCLCYSFSTLFI